jgi:serine protease Do
MNNDYENENKDLGAEQHTGQPVSDGENAAGEIFEPASPTDSQKEREGIQMKAPDPRKDAPSANNAYYEPWHEPVYRETKDRAEPYSPGIHSGAFYAHQKTAQFEPQPPAPKRERHIAGGLVRALCLILVCGIVSAAASYGVIEYRIRNGDLEMTNQVVLGSDNNTFEEEEPSAGMPSETPQASPKPAENTTGLTTSGAVMSPEDIYDMAVQQVVGVNTEYATNAFGQSTSTAVSGSGFIISNDGYIVTNYHVVEIAEENGLALTVILHDGTKYPAKIVGYEQDNDVAVIKIEATGLHAVTTGSNDAMKVGETVYAIGNPLGELDYTMTNGIVSALDRVIAVDESTSINMFQIDAAVNSGNSGGPVYNSRGEVIGIVSAKYSSAGVEGLGFAIPIDDAINIVSELIENGYISGKPSMGITVRNVPNSAMQYYGLVEGALVEGVTPGSCADKAGIKVGDIITKLGDTVISSTDTLKLAKKNFKAGETTTVTVNREGEELSLSITFDEEGITQTASSSPLLPR